MKYRDGYLCGYDDLTQLPVDILEDIIIRIYQDGLHCIWKSGTGKIRKKDVIRTKSAIYGECFAGKSADILLLGCDERPCLRQRKRTGRQ